MRIFGGEGAESGLVFDPPGYNIGAAVDYKVVEITPVFGVFVYNEGYRGVGRDVLYAPESFPFRFFGLFVEGSVNKGLGIHETDRNDQRPPGRGSGCHPGYPC